MYCFYINAKYRSGWVHSKQWPAGRIKICHPNEKALFAEGFHTFTSI
jgi:hypothetical protein